VTGGFFFHGMSGNFSPTLTVGAGGLAISNSGSPAAPAPGAVMFPFQDAMRACKP